MTDKNKVRCYNCNGSGQCQKTRQVIDQALSLCMGVATGIGYMPMYKTEYYTESCYACGGKGEKDE